MAAEGTAPADNVGISVSSNFAYITTAYTKSGSKFTSNNRFNPIGINKNNIVTIEVVDSRMKEPFYFLTYMVGTGFNNLIIDNKTAATILGIN